MTHSVRVRSRLSWSSAAKLLCDRSSIGIRVRVHVAARTIGDEVCCQLTFMAPDQSFAGVRELDGVTICFEAWGDGLFRIHWFFLDLDNLPDFEDRHVSVNGWATRIVPIAKGTKKVLNCVREGVSRSNGQVTGGISGLKDMLAAFHHWIAKWANPVATVLVWALIAKLAAQHAACARLIVAVADSLMPQGYFRDPFSAQPASHPLKCHAADNKTDPLIVLTAVHESLASYPDAIRLDALIAIITARDEVYRTLVDLAPGCSVVGTRVENGFTIMFEAWHDAFVVGGIALSSGENPVTDRDNPAGLC